MAHVRKQIREAFRDVLLGLPTTEHRVFTGRAWPLSDDADIPGLVISMIDSDGERSEVDAIGRPVTLARVAQVSVMGYGLSLDVEDQLDTIAEEVETAIATDFNAGDDSRLGTLCRDLQLVSTQIGLEPEKRRLGEIRITYEIEYRTVTTVPDAAV